MSDQYGGYNDFPFNWRSITKDEFARQLVNKCLEHDESRQMFDNDNRFKEPVSARLFFFADGTGVAVSSKYQAQGLLEYAYVGEFWAFGCDHDFEHIDWDPNQFGPLMNCDHVVKCKICGYTETYNSSD